MKQKEQQIFSISSVLYILFIIPQKMLVSGICLLKLYNRTPQTDLVKKKPF